jgi:hypothetical protein
VDDYHDRDFVAVDSADEHRADSSASDTFERHVDYFCSAVECSVPTNSDNGRSNNNTIEEISPRFDVNVRKKSDR